MLRSPPSYSITGTVRERRPTPVSYRQGKLENLRELASLRCLLTHLPKSKPRFASICKTLPFPHAYIASPPVPVRARDRYMGVGCSRRLTAAHRTSHNRRWQAPNWPVTMLLPVRRPPSERKWDHPLSPLERKARWEFSKPLSLSLSLSLSLCTFIILPSPSQVYCLFLQPSIPGSFRCSVVHSASSAEIGSRKPWSDHTGPSPTQAGGSQQCPHHIGPSAGGSTRRVRSLNLKAQSITVTLLNQSSDCLDCLAQGIIK